MTEAKKFIVTDGPINHDHELYQNGDEIELTEKGAKRLLAEKKISVVKPSAKNGEGGKEGLKDGDPVAGKTAGGNQEDEKDSKGSGQDGKKNDDSKDKTKGQIKGGKK